MSEIYSTNYKGHAIEFEPHSGKFTFRLNGELVRVASLTAAKKRIDAAITYPAFTALRRKDYSDQHDKDAPDYREVRVIGVRKPAGGRAFRSSDYTFVIEGRDRNSRQYSRLYENTPENLAALRAADELEAEFNRVKSDYEARIRAAREKCVELPAYSALEGKPEPRKP